MSLIALFTFVLSLLLLAHSRQVTRRFNALQGGVIALQRRLEEAECQLLEQVRARERR